MPTFTRSGTILELPESGALIQECKDFIQSVREGELKAQHAAREANQTSGDGAAPAVNAEGENIPF